MDNSAPRQNFNPNTLGDDLKRESKSKWLEATASRQFCKQLKEEGFTFTRVETGSTHRGFPDIVCGHKDLEAVVFIEMKAGLHKVEPAQLHFLKTWWELPSVLTVVVRAENPKKWRLEFPHVDLDTTDILDTDGVFKSPADLIRNGLIPNMNLTWAYEIPPQTEDGDDDEGDTNEGNTKGTILDGSQYCEGRN